MKVAAITYSSPWGRAELFVTRELSALKEKCAGLVVVPLIPSRKLFHAVGRPLLEDAVWLPVVNVRMALGLGRYGLCHPSSLSKVLLTLLRSARSLKILAINLAVLPKAVYIAQLMTKMKVDHIYVNWATAPATMGFIISRLTGIPWSVRAHRWDIYQNNMLAAKVASAKCVLCVSEVTKDAVLGIVGQRFRDKVFVRNIGMYIEPLSTASIRARIIARRQLGLFHVVTPANLVPVKGHRYLLEACAELLSAGVKTFQVTLFGEGPLRAELERSIAEYGLCNVVAVHAAIPNEELLGLYRDNQVDLVVLPSIITAAGEHEGLPTVLVEAMAFGIPVISTNTGGIPELLSNGAGVLVDEKSGAALASAMARVLKEPEFAVAMALGGRKKVESEHDIGQTVEWMLASMKGECEASSVD